MNSKILVAVLAAGLSVGDAFAQTVVKRINCGGGAVVSLDGASFAADVPYAVGVQDGFEGGTAQTSIASSDLIGGYDNPRRTVFSSARVDWTAYRIEVPNGDYIVRLLLAEILNQGVDLRKMSVSIEGVPVLVDVDLADLVGVQYGAAFTTTATVTDGVLDIEAAPGPGLDLPEVEAAILCGLEVFTAPVSLPGPGAVGGFTVLPSYHMNLLYWDWNVSPTIQEHSVLRADDVAGPYASIATLWASPPRYLDESAVPGQTYFYKVVATDVLGNPGTESGVLSATTLDSANSPLPVYEILIDAADLKFISRNILDDPSTEVPATFLYGGQAYVAEARFRGASSRLHSKKSWKVKFPSTGKFFGRTDLNLKASFLDRSMIRERLSFHLWEQVGTPGSEILPVHLLVNGRYLGVFNQAENVDEKFLSSRGFDPGPSLYKVDDGNLMVLAAPEDYEVGYDKQINTSIDYTDLIDLIEFLNAAPTGSFEQELVDRIDIDAYLSYLSVIGWDGDIDNVTQNYFLSHDLDIDRWEILPWDGDYSWGLIPLMAFVPINVGTSGYDPDPAKINQLRERALGLDSLLWRYCEKVRELDTLHANMASLDPVIAAFHGEITDDVLADPYKLGWETHIKFDASLSALQTLVPFRSSAVLGSVASLQPATPPTVVWINELSAASQSTFPDEMGEFEDWVELYNASGAPVDVSGMFLTDDLGAAPTWSFPPGTVIPALGHVVVFCDDDAGDGPLHADFKLGASGEELGLFDVDGTTLLDFIAWRPQFDEVSFGRYADGKQFFRFLPTPTPGSSNTTVGNLAPLVTCLEHVPGLPQSDDPVTVGVQVTDAGGVGPVVLNYRVDGGAFVPAAMASVGFDRYEAGIPGLPDGSLVEYYVSAEDTVGATTVRPDGAPGTLMTYLVADPILSGFRINELLASNDTVVQDEAGDFEDYVEIYNETGAAIDMTGMYLTDSLGNPTKWPFPPGTSIPAGGFLLVWADNEPLEGPLHATFKLSGGGEEVGLFASDGATLIDGFAYGPQTTDIAFGTMPDASPNRYVLFVPSPGASNLPSEGEVRSFEYADPAVNSVEIAAFTAPAIGTGLVIVISTGMASEVGTVFFGFGSTLVDFGADGFLLVPNELPSLAKYYVTDGNGAAAIARQIPGDPGLIGVTLFAQSFAEVGGLSNALAATIGP
jgi:hypothetical protein